MPDYGSALQFGLSVTPETAQIEAISELVQLADITGLDLVAIQDHADNHTFLDTWTLIAFPAAKTRHARRSRSAAPNRTADPRPRSALAARGTCG
jgi:alkanesulfonate monooxygenase SsuD/methylene tetrahydromethanopterin reductase-like flavin-dependent oxidoreductase (luciferase family)